MTWTWEPIICFLAKLNLSWRFRSDWMCNYRKDIKRHWEWMESEKNYAVSQMWIVVISKIVQCNDAAMHVYLRLPNVKYSLAQGDQSRAQILFLWTALCKLLACSFWHSWHNPTGFPLGWKVPTPLFSWHLITVKFSKIRFVCAVHVFTSVTQCIGSILSWVSFREGNRPNIVGQTLSVA